jgi:hypothetical protein
MVTVSLVCARAVLAIGTAPIAATIRTVSHPMQIADLAVESVLAPKQGRNSAVVSCLRSF